MSDTTIPPLDETLRHLGVAAATTSAMRKDITEDPVEWVRATLDEGMRHLRATASASDHQEKVWRETSRVN